jgi:hypothetical protein
MYDSCMRKESSGSRGVEEGPVETCGLRIASRCVQVSQSVLFVVSTGSHTC